jgi:NADH:ubiquinone oxidoreductase subunit 5 (subunit L)/multisubunit Na+/H+ antiporter MnhA subunit
MGMSVAIAILGAVLGYRRYSGEVKSEQVRDPFKIDSFYGFVFGRGTKALSGWIGKYLEENFFQRIIQFSAAAVDLGGNLFKTVQTGSAQGYLMMMVLSVAILICWLIFGVKGYGNF